MLIELAKLDSQSYDIPMELEFYPSSCEDAPPTRLSFKSPCFYVNLYSFDERDKLKDDFAKVDLVIPEDILETIKQECTIYEKTYNKKKAFELTVFPSKPYGFVRKVSFSVIGVPIESTDINRRTSSFHSFYISREHLTYLDYRDTYCYSDSPLFKREQLYDVFNLFRSEPKNITISDNQDAINYGLESLKKLQNPVTEANIEEVRKNELVKSLKEKFKAFTEKNKNEEKSDIPSKQVDVSVPEDEIKLINLDSLKKISGSENPERDLNKLIGLASVKEEVARFSAISKFNNEFSGMNTEGQSMHMCYLGNPGTGKTTVARIMTGMLYNMGYIKKNQCIEVNALEMCGNYVGQTGQITAKIINEAKGGVLFIDEAYSLAFGGTSFGQEAVSVLLKEMEDNRDNLVVIFAGYAGPMNKFLDMNSGFRSRINHYFNFEDYSLYEMLDIINTIFNDKKLTVDKDAMGAIVAAVEKAIKQENFSNGRYARNLVEKIEDEHVMSVPLLISFNKYSEEQKQRFATITIDDIPEDILNTQ